MKKRLIQKRLKNLLTGTMLLVTVLLWGYIIGSVLESRKNDGMITSFVVNGIPPNLEVTQQPSGERPKGSDESLDLFADPYRRFAERGTKFNIRLNQDNRFLLDNSF